MAKISPLFRTVFVVIPMLMYAVPASAQIASTKPYASLFLIRDVNGVDVPEAARALPLMSGLTAAGQVPAMPRNPSVKGTPRACNPRCTAACWCCRDSTCTRRCAPSTPVTHEQNPLMRWTVAHPAAFISMKAAASAATIYVAEKIRKRHPKRALLFMAAVNSAYAFIVVHNYNVPIR